ncbi:MAG: pitrilysin family protein [Blastocatellia bacterium]
MKSAIFQFKRTLFVISMSALLTGSALAQGQSPSSKGSVIKGKAPVNKEVLKVKLPKPYETKLSNGLQVLVLEDHKLPSFNMQMVVIGGGLADSADRPGAAQYTATMLREGTRTRDSKKIAEEVDQLGASLFANAGLSSLTSTVSASGLTDNFDPIMALFADVILNPGFPADEFNKLKGRNIAAIRLQRSNPGFLAGEMFSKVIYGSHPGGRSSLSAEQIGRITPEVLQQFHATYYKPNNAIFAIVGDVKPAEVVAKLEKTFAAWKAGDVPKTMVPKVAEIGAAKIYLIDRPGSVQTNLVAGTLSIERTDPDYFALEVMNQVVGGGPSARLFMNLREDKGYTYGAYSNVSSQKYRGTFQASTQVRTDVTGGSMKELFYEFKRIRDDRVPADEFDRAKRTIIGGWALQLESPQSVLQNTITSKLYDLPADYWDTYPQKIAAVTPDDAQRVAQKYLDLGKLQIVAVGDAQKIAEALRKYGTVETYDTEGKPLKSPTTSTGGNGGNMASAGIAGIWNITADTPDGPMQLKAMIKMTGSELGGSVETPHGPATITGGSVNGNGISFKIKGDVNGQTVIAEFTGKLDGDTMKGQITAEGFSAAGFTGKKEK